MVTGTRMVAATDAIRRVVVSGFCMRPKMSVSTYIPIRAAAVINEKILLNIIIFLILLFISINSITH